MSAALKSPSPRELDRLERLIFLYLEAARLKHREKTNDLSNLVEAFAKEIGYEDHARLHSIHTQAEQSLE